MSRPICILLIVTAFFLGAREQSAQAGFDIAVGDVITFSDGPGSPGGIFKIDVERTTPTLDFETFCVELTEHIAFNTKYIVTGIGLVTNAGNMRLGAQSAWLYTQFLKGSNGEAHKLVGFDFANPTEKQADALQLGIWLGLTHNVDEVPYDDSFIASKTGWSKKPNYISDLRNVLTPWITNFESDVSNGLWSANSTGNIQIMNLRKRKSNGDPGDYAQDQLVWMGGPLDPHVVPELPTLYSASLLVGGGSLWAVLAFFKKRRAAPATAA